MQKQQLRPKAIDVFSKIPSFSGVDTTTLEAVARSATQRNIDAGLKIEKSPKSIANKRLSCNI